MRRLPVLILILTLALPLLSRAQAPTDSLSVADTLGTPKDFVTEAGSFREGSGAAVDTLDIQDGRLLLVLRDDHTWY